MVLEATMICIDNSEWMRNGDYSPTRLEAQLEAISLICGAKIQSNPENTVGVMSMAGKAPRVLTTPTSDFLKMLNCTYGLEIGGECNVAAAVQVAQLALKHRQNKNGRQRIVLLVGSPVNADKKALEAVGKKLRKNSVVIDVVNFGEEETEKFEALVGRGGTSSHIIDARRGGGGGGFDSLHDVLRSRGGEILGGGGGVRGYEWGGGEFGGVDPNVEPELVIAIRESLLEEERRRLEAVKLEQESRYGAGAGGVDVMEDEDEEALLQKALALSLENPNGGLLASQDTDMTEVDTDGRSQ